MIVIRQVGRILSLLYALAFASGCTTEIFAPTAQNPPPSKCFQEFAEFRLEPVELNPAYAENEYNLKATAAIDRNLSASLSPVIAGWENGGGPTLVIKPR